MRATSRSSIKNVVVDGDTTLNKKVIRDWASIEGGAKVGKFTPPDYGPFGCGPEQLLDLNLGTGWGSDAVGSTEGSNNDGPRKVVIKLPKAVDITSFAVASTGACGDGPEAGVKKFKVETKTAGGGWITAFVGTAPNNGKLLTYVPNDGQGQRPVRAVHHVVEPRRPAVHGRDGVLGPRQVADRGFEHERAGIRRPSRRFPVPCPTQSADRPLPFGARPLGVASTRVRSG